MTVFWFSPTCLCDMDSCNSAGAELLSGAGIGSMCCAVLGGMGREQLKIQPERLGRRAQVRDGSAAGFFPRVLLRGWTRKQGFCH